MTGNKNTFIAKKYTLTNKEISGEYQNRLRLYLIWILPLFKNQFGYF